MPPAPSKPAAVLTLFDFIPLGDGCFKAVPRKPVQTASITQAAKITGMERVSIYRLYKGGFVTGTQATPRRITVDLASLAKHIEDARNPNFWTADRTARYNTGVPN